MKKKWIVIAVILASILVFMHLAIQERESKPLKGVCEVLEQDSWIYMLDNGGETLNVYKTYPNGIIYGEIVIEKLKGALWNHIEHLTVDHSDGTVYVMGDHLVLSEEEEEKSGSFAYVYRCDFEKERLIPVWEIPEDCGPVQVKNGSLYYAAAAEEENQTVWNRVDGSGELTEVARADFPFSLMVYSFYSNEYGSVWTDYHGSLYVNSEKIPCSCKKTDVHMYYVADESRIIYTDLATETVEIIDLGQLSQETMLSLPEIQTGFDGVIYSDVMPYHYEQDGSWSAALDLSGDQRSAGFFNEDGKLTLCVSHVRRPVSVMLVRSLRRFIWWIAAAFVVWKTGAVLLKRMHGTVPVLAKLLAVLIPVIAGGSTILVRQIEGDYKEQISRMESSLLYEIAQISLAKINPEDIRNIDIGKIPDDSYYRRIFPGVSYNRLPEKINFSQTGEEMLVLSGSFNVIYLFRDDELFYFNSSGQYIGSRVSFRRDRDQVGLMHKAITDRTVVGSEYNDQNGNFNVLYIPIYDEEGLCVGMMESGVRNSIVTYEIRQRMTVVKSLVWMVMAVLTGVLALVLVILLTPLTRLKQAVKALTGGNLGIKVPVHGRDEVAGISSAFNEMSETMKQQVDFNRDCLYGYARFVPEKILEILGREDITRAKMGDQQQVKGSVLSAGSVQFHQLARKWTGEEMYAVMNQALEEMIPEVLKRDGVVDRIWDGGLTAFYPDDKSGALDSAVSICECIYSLKKQGINLPIFRMAVVYGDIRVGIVGHERRAAACTVSELIPLSEFLLELGETYGASVMITGSAAEQIPDFQTRYHVRMIGFIYLKAAEKAEAVYDVFDGDSQEDRKNKEETGQLFRDGVSEFWEGKYYEARLKFAQVLRINRNDGAAREYVYRCDTYYREKDLSKINHYLEQY